MTPEERKLLDIVLEKADGREYMVRDGVRRALYSVENPARRTYLWNILQRAALKRIRAAQRMMASARTSV